VTALLEIVVKEGLHIPEGWEQMGTNGIVDWLLEQ